MKIGIVGLKNSGKSTIFSALTGVEIDLQTYKKTPNLATIKIPDNRLDQISQIFPDKNKINTTIDFTDIAETSDQSVKGFSTETINQLKYCDEILVVIRAFKDDTISSPIGKIDINLEYDTMKSDLIISDSLIIESRLQKLEKNIMKRKDENEIKEFEILQKCKECLDKNMFLNTTDFSPRDDKILRGFQFLTYKPIIFTINMDEEDIINESEIVNSLKIGEEIGKYNVIAISGKLEEEIMQLEEDEAKEFRDELGIKEPGIEKLIKTTYATLDLVSFFTIGDKEVRSWMIKKDTHAREAAGKIHTDFEKGFIKAEVVSWEQLIEHGSMTKCKEIGILRTEGKDYPVKDGDVIYFRFNI